MKLIYVCSPLRSEPKEEKRNREYAIKCSKYVIDNGEAPVAPHIFVPEYMTDDDDWETANKTLLNKCDELWVFGNTISDGMKNEIEYFKGEIKYIERV